VLCHGDNPHGGGEEEDLAISVSELVRFLACIHHKRMPRPATGINDPQANGSACRARPAPRPAPQSTASPSGAWPLGHFPDDLRVDDLRPAPPRGPRTVQASQEAAALRLRGRFLLLARVRVPGPGPCPGGRDGRPCCGPSAVLAPIPAAASAPARRRAPPAAPRPPPTPTATGSMSASRCRSSRG